MFFDFYDQPHVPPTNSLDECPNRLKASHLINGLDVLIDRRYIEGLVRLRNK